MMPTVKNINSRTIHPSSKIYIAGHNGLVGSALLEKFKNKGYSNLLLRNHKQLDLLIQNEVFDFLKIEKPDYIVIAAAKVGGIIANNKYRAQFIYENLTIMTNLIHGAYLAGIDNILFLGSSCIYPKDSPQPIKESYLMTDRLEYTNEPYAISKIAGIKMCESYNIQYGTNYISVMPTNLYGPNDNFDLEKSHVLPALIRKIYLGKCLEEKKWDSIRRDLNQRPIEEVSGEERKQDILNVLDKYGVTTSESFSSVEIWGSGKPEREFLHSEDLADACLYILENINLNDIESFNKVTEFKVDGDSSIKSPLKFENRNNHINIGTGTDISILDLAQMVKKIIGFKGSFIHNLSKPDGTPKKVMNVERLEKLGWKYKIELKDGISKLYNWYLS